MAINRNFIRCVQQNTSVVNILGLGVKKILMIGTYCPSISSQHRSLNVSCRASPDSLNNPHYQRCDCHWSVPELIIRCGGFPHQRGCSASASNTSPFSLLPSVKLYLHDF
ncbi:hypothetical protein Tco_1394281 [Tanacetum coccineum]